MAKARKAKTAAAANLPIPQSDAEAEQQIAQLGASHRDQAEAQARHDAAIAALEEAHGRNVKEFLERQKALTAGLERYASVHRERLTNGGRSKTVQLASGKLFWREGRFSVKHRGLKNADVVEVIRAGTAAVAVEIAKAKAAKERADLPRLQAILDTLGGFLRHKVEPDKEAMIKAREIAETLPGISVPRGPEEFAVEPLASQISEVAA